MPDTRFVFEDDGVNESQPWPGPPEESDFPFIDDYPELNDLAEDAVAIQQVPAEPVTPLVQ